MGMKLVMILTMISLVLPGCTGNTGKPGDAPSTPFSKDNLVAWCIVPFDSLKRTPEARAAMLKKLGITRLAYDWREQHIPEFDRELDALQQNGITLDAFWMPCGIEKPLENPNVQLILDFLKRRSVRTQLWVSLSMKEAENLPQEEKVTAAARSLDEVAKAAEAIGCTVGLYNHGGWFGEPENLVAIIKQMKQTNTGIVYNFHHAHNIIDRFGDLFPLMRPHLIALNLDGMRREGPMILPLGTGDSELGMLKIVQASGWTGPIGILGHQAQRDVEICLQENLDGLKKLLGELGDRAALATY